MPYSQEAEQSVLGAILLDSSYLNLVLEILPNTEAFYEPNNRLIYETMVEMFSSGKKIDYVTVLDNISIDSVQKEEMKNYMLDIVQIVPSISNVESYSKIIRDKYELRNLISLAKDVLQESTVNGDSEKLLEFTEERLNDIRMKKSKEAIVSLKDILVDEFEKLGKLNSEDCDEILGLSTGYNDLDFVITGLNKSDLILLAARPGMGKTSFALNIAKYVSEKSKTVVFSLEMGKEQLAARLLSMAGKIAGNKLRCGKLNDDEWKRLIKASDGYSNSNLYIDDTACITVNEMKARVRRLGDVSLVIIDYLQILQKKDKNKFKEEKLLYSPAISKKNFDSLFKNELSEGEASQKKSPLEYLKKMIELILNFEVNNINSKHTIYQYFSLSFLKIEFESNIDFSFDDNEELYTLFLYDWIYSEISSVLTKIYDKITKSNMEFQQKLTEFCLCMDDINKVKKLKTKDVENNNIIIFLYSYFYRDVENASCYVNLFRELIYYCLDNWNKETLYIFRYILNEMLEYINGNKKLIDVQSKEFIELDNYYKLTQKKFDLKNLVKPEFMKMIKIEGNNLKLNIKGNVNTLKDYNHYNLTDLLTNMLTIPDYNEISFNLYKNKYINIKYFNENNIIRACDKFISGFLEYIGKSNTIISLLNSVFPGYSNYENIKFEAWLPSYLLNFYKKINFYKQHLGTLAITQESNLEIDYLFFVDDNENIGLDIVTFSNIVVNLGFFTYSFYHESLGHLLLRFLNILTKMNYYSPRNANDEVESGQFIESLLFNQRKSEYNIYELLYIIDIDNYKVDFKTFRKNFQSINKNYKPSQNFINMFKDIGLETEKNLSMIKSKKKITKYKLGISNINNSCDTKYGPMNLNSCVLRKKQFEKDMNEFHRKIIEKYGSMENYFDKILSLFENYENE